MEVWLLVNLGYPFLVILVNIALQVHRNTAVVTSNFVFCVGSSQRKGGGKEKASLEDNLKRRKSIWWVAGR